jgi:MFS family permease
MTLGTFVGSCSAGKIIYNQAGGPKYPNSLLLGPFACYLGQKLCLHIAVVLVCVANIVMMTTDSIAGLYTGRLVIGLGNGLLMTFSQLYIQV